MSYELPFTPDMLDGLVSWFDAANVGRAFPRRRVLYDDLWHRSGEAWTLAAHVANTGQRWHEHRPASPSMYADRAYYAASHDGLGFPPMTAHLGFNGDANEAAYSIDGGVADAAVSLWWGDSAEGARLCWRVATDLTAEQMPPHFEWNPVTGTVQFGTWGAFRAVQRWIKGVGPRLGGNHLKRVEAQCVGDDHYLLIDGQVIAHFQDDANKTSTRVGLVAQGAGFFDGPLVVDAIGLPAFKVYENDDVLHLPDVMRQHASPLREFYGAYRVLAPKLRLRNDNLLVRAAAVPHDTSGWEAVDPSTALSWNSDHHAVLCTRVSPAPGDRHVITTARHLLPDEHAYTVGMIRARRVDGPNRVAWPQLHAYQSEPPYLNSLSTIQGPVVSLGPEWRNLWTFGAIGHPVTSLALELAATDDEGAGSWEFSTAFLGLLDLNAERRLADIKVTTRGWWDDAGALPEDADFRSPSGGKTVRFRSTARSPIWAIAPTAPGEEKGYLLALSMHGTTAHQQIRVSVQFRNSLGQWLNMGGEGHSYDFYWTTEKEGWQTLYQPFTITGGLGVAGLVAVVQMPFDDGTRDRWVGDVRFEVIEPGQPVDLSEGPVIQGGSAQFGLPDLPVFTVAGRFRHDVGDGQGAVQVLQVSTADGTPFNPVMAYNDGWRYFDGSNNANPGPNETWATYVVEMSEQSVRTWVNGSLQTFARGSQREVLGLATLSPEQLRRFVIYDRALTDSERVALEAFLATPAPLP